MTATEWFMKAQIEQLEKENKNLKAELKQLEERYDRNAELYKRLLEENKKLKEELEEQKAEWWWLMDEIDYRKREAKRLWWKAKK